MLFIGITLTLLEWWLCLACWARVIVDPTARDKEFLEHVCEGA